MSMKDLFFKVKRLDILEHLLKSSRARKVK